MTVVHYYIYIILAITILQCCSETIKSKLSNSRYLNQFNLLLLRGGYDSINGEESSLSYIKVSGAPEYLHEVDGLYVQTEWNHNNHAHYEKVVDQDSNDISKYHLYWSGKQWVLNHDLNPSSKNDNAIAYARIHCEDPTTTRGSWHVKKGKSYQQWPSIELIISNEPDSDNEQYSSKEAANAYKKLVSKTKKNNDIFGIPRVIFPHFLAFMCDAIAVGLAMPLLPFYVMELGANALQLSVVVSANYVAQMIGCILMGKVSDLYGRRIVLLSCLAASSLSLFCVSRANTLVTIALARIISGSFGGLLPVMQSSVADVAEIDDRPKYLGRIMATFGLGFVLGPAINTALPNMSARKKIRLAAALPLTGLIVALLFSKETKKDVKGPFVRSAAPYKKPALKSTVPKVPEKKVAPLTFEVIFLVLNGFLIMYAFATETIYAMFLKDSFGYGERVLSALFAFNGTLMGIFQVFFIKPLINLIGKHATLVVGNALLGAGMVGLALVRQPALHFSMFALHILGYSIADTSLVSLISRYSAPSSQGRDLALNQAAQSCARIFSPLCAGILYEYSKRPDGVLPVGALPFLAGGICPAVAILVPSLLYVRNITKKKAAEIEKKQYEDSEDNLSWEKNKNNHRAQQKRDRKPTK